MKKETIRKEFKERDALIPEWLSKDIANNQMKFRKVQKTLRIRKNNKKERLITIGLIALSIVLFICWLKLGQISTVNYNNYIG